MTINERDIQHAKEVILSSHAFDKDTDRFDRYGMPIRTHSDVFTIPNP